MRGFCLSFNRTRLLVVVPLIPLLVPLKAFLNMVEGIPERVEALKV